MRRFPRWLKWLIVVFFVGLLARLAIQPLLAALAVGPTQPVPFSHRIHATTKEINCFFCHQYATVSNNPGMPAVEKCLLCHNVIASNFPPIAKVRAYDRRRQGIPWVRVSRVPDFVHFSHQAHLARGFDCSRCLGNVKAMDRIRMVHKFDMNFCTTCHRQNNGPIDCYTCHY
jgi:hypothetical protein